MHVRCPHCHQPVELVENAELEHIDCPSCGAAVNVSGDAAVDDEALRAQAITDVAEAPTLAPAQSPNPAEAETVGRSSDAAVIAKPDEGRAFGEYELLAEIARGGMGVVFKARQRRLNRTVAVKMILAGQLADQDEVRRFMTEAESAAGLDHPGIVPVYESGEIDGQNFFSMGYVDGQSLAALLAAGPLPPPRAAELVAQVADAVDYAHQRGVIHRDLKPGNILLDHDGHPRITDFGLAKRITGDSNLTRTGQALGTPSYMPPEQASGKLDAIGRPADVYALGAVLYAMLTGRPPFLAATPLDTILQLLEQEPVPPRQLNADVHRDLETIALKCLQKEPHKRYATASELADELQRFLRGEPILARPVGRIERSLRWCKRNPVITSLAASVVVALLAGTGISTYFAIEERTAKFAAEQAAKGERQQAIAAKADRDRADREAAAAVAARNRAEEQRTLTESREAEARNLLNASRMNLALRSWNDSKITEVLDYLTSLIPTMGQQDLRGPEWHLLWRLCHSELQTVPLQPASGIQDSLAFALMLPDSVRFNASAQQLAISDSPHGQVVILDCLTWRPVATVGGLFSEADDAGKLTQHRLKSIRAVLPLAGDRIAISTSTIPTASEVTVRDIKSNEVIWRLNGQACLVTGLTADSGGRFLVTGSRSPHLEYTIWDLATGRVVQTISDPESGTGGRAYCAVSPGGDSLAGVVGTTEAEKLRVWDIDSGQAVYTTGDLPGGVKEIAFSPDGSLIAVGSRDGSVSLRDAATGAIKHVCRAQEAEAGGILQLERGMTLEFSSDSRRLLIGTRDATLQVWEVASGHLQQVFKGHTLTIVAANFLRDGRILSVSVDGTAKVWPADGGVDAVSLGRHTMQITAIAFSQNGRWLASGSMVGPVGGANVKLWDVQSGRLVRQLHAPGGQIQSLSFSPDGRRLASASMDNTVIVWDVLNGQPIKTLTGFLPPTETDRIKGQFVDDIGFLSDGRRLLTHRANEIRIWNIETGLSEGEPIPTRLGIHALSADGNWLAWASPNTNPADAAKDVSIMLRDLREENGAREIAKGSPTRLCLSDDGHFLAEGRTYGMVAVWDVGTRELKSTWKCPLPMFDPAYRLSLSRDGRRLLTASTDGKLKLWDVTSGEDVYTLESPLGDVSGLEVYASTRATAKRLGFAAFSPVDNRIAAACVNSVLLWNTAPESTEPLHEIAVPAAVRPSASPSEVITASGAPSSVQPVGASPTTDRLKRLGQAFARFHDTNSFFPASSYDKDGKPLLSWRVQILPFVASEPLYKQFHLDEPWDSEHNRPLAAQMPSIFHSDDIADAERTIYLASTGPKALFPKGKSNDGRNYGEVVAFNRDGTDLAWARKVAYPFITDGTSNTVLLVEADARHAVVWSKPDDLDFDADEPLKALGMLRRTGFNALFCDGSVKFIRSSINPDVLRHLFDPRDGQHIEWGRF